MLTRVNIRPKQPTWEVEIDGRKYETEDELLEKVQKMVRRKVFYRRTEFGSMAGKVYPARQRHFKTGYYLYTFWFTSPNDATIVKMLT